MNPDELRSIVTFLRQRVRLGEGGAAGETTIAFDAPAEDELDRADLDLDACRRILDAPWWDEMMCDIVETPKICDPEDSPEQILEYARDVISEYIAKRLTP